MVKHWETEGSPEEQETLKRFDEVGTRIDEIFKGVDVAFYISANIRNELLVTASRLAEVADPGRLTFRRQSEARSSR